MPSDQQNLSADSRRPSRRAVLAMAGTSAAALTTSGKLFARQNFDRNLAALVATQSSEETNLKKRAREDYRRSMARFGGQLANTPEELFHTSTLDPVLQFDVVIVGSGYGASVVASRLARRLRSGGRLAIIERGKEWIPGDFDDTFSGLFRQARGQLAGQKKRTIVNPLGLHNVIMNDEVNVWTGNGLGGGSLINANVALIPDAEVFTKFLWPAELRYRDTLLPWYQAAAAGLNLARTPWDQTSKVQARRTAADRLFPAPGFFDLSPLSVMYDERWLDQYSKNPQEMIQRPCTLCGDCISGCNIGAKNTLTMNYLPVAKSFGAEIYTQTEVRSIEKMDGRYRLEIVHYDDRDCGIERRYTSVWTRKLILAAGSPGSPELLLRSREKGLCLSEALGHRWSGNGDTLGFIINKQDCCNIGGIGASDQKPGVAGPTVQTSLNYKHRPVLEDRFLIQDAAIPRAATPLFRILLQDRDLNHSAVMLGMGHDGAVGRVQIDDKGKALIKWPGLKDAPFRQAIWREFERIAGAEGGQYKRLAAFGDNLVSVHPLGGCALADDPVDGVVNASGQVFDGTFGGYAAEDGTPAVHEGLYVADGSIIPSSLGCNPFMTISALAMRIAEGILADPANRELFGQKQSIFQPASNR
jgi:cholesterol oxidase